MDRPKARGYIDIDKIIHAGECYLDAVEFDEGEPDSDVKHYLFEKVMEILYGEDVWKWVSEKIN